MVHSVSLNREASPTVARSTLAIKADAARRLFAISCRDLTWAVIDSGIDARHPAFRLRDPKSDQPVSERPFVDGKGKTANCTRVVDTYDFTQIDLLLDPDSPELPAQLKKRLQAGSPAAKKLRQQVEELYGGLRRGRAIDWGLIDPLHPRPARRGRVHAPGERSRHARGRDPGRRLAEDGVRRPARGRPDRRVPGPPPLRPARARRGGAGRRVRGHGRPPVRPLPQLDERVRRRPRREPEPVDPARGLQLRVRPDAGLRGVRAGGLVRRRGGGRGRQPGLPAVHDGDGRHRRGLPQHQHHRPGQRRDGDHRRRHPPLPARTPTASATSPAAGRPATAGASPTWSRRARRSRRRVPERRLRPQGRHQHGRAARQRRRGAADGPPQRAGRPPARASSRSSARPRPTSAANATSRAPGMLDVLRALQSV